MKTLLSPLPFEAFEKSPKTLDKCKTIDNYVTFLYLGELKVYIICNSTPDMHAHTIILISDLRFVQCLI